MKNTDIIVFYIFAVLLWPAETLSQNVMYSIGLSLQDSTLNSFGMGYLNVYLGDTTSNNQVSIISGSDFFQFKTPGNDWVALPSNELIIAGEIGNKTLSNNQFFQYFDLFPFYINNIEEYRFIIENGGVIEIRYCISVVDTSENTLDLHSNTILMNLPPIDSTDLHALDYILTNKDKFGRVENFTSLYVDPTNIYVLPVYEYITENYPNSIFGQIAKSRFAFDLCREHGFESLSPNIRTQVQQVYDELSLSTILPVKKVLGDLQECLEN